MSERPYMQLWIADYLADTQHLSVEQSGCYLHLLMAMWTAGGSLPNDPKVLARVCKMTVGKWRRVADAVLALMTVDGAKITQKRLQKELQKAREIAAKRSAAASTKLLNDNKTSPAKATTNAEQKHPKRAPAPQPLPVYSEAKASGVPPEFPDLRKQVFDLALPTLKTQGHGEREARAIIGRWRKLAGSDDAALVATLAQAARTRPADLVAWMGRALSTGPPQRLSRTQQAMLENIEEFDNANRNSGRGVCGEGGSHAAGQLPKPSARPQDVWEAVDAGADW